MRIAYNLKRLKDAIRTLSISKELISHDHWTRKDLEKYRQQQLSRLVKHAVKHSPFYKEFYANISLDDPIRLDQLPILDKKTMMENSNQCDFSLMGPTAPKDLLVLA